MDKNQNLTFKAKSGKILLKLPYDSLDLDYDPLEK